VDFLLFYTDIEESERVPFPGEFNINVIFLVTHYNKKQDNVIRFALSIDARYKETTATSNIVCQKQASEGL